MMFFVAYNLAKLAEETLNCTSEVLDMRDSESKRSLLRHLANSHPVLVPYPFCRHHWLIPTCLVITTDEIHGKWGGGCPREYIIFAGPEMHMQQYLSSMCIVPL